MDQLVNMNMNCPLDNRTYQCPTPEFDNYTVLI